MRFVLMLGIATLAGCTTVADLREGGPFIQSMTAKAPEAFSGCLADQWASRSGSVASIPRENGISLTLSYKVYSNTTVAAVVDVQRTASGSEVKVYAGKGDANSKLRGEVSSCL